MKPSALPTVLILLSAVMPAAAQDAKDFVGVDQKRVDKAIREGIGYLRRSPLPDIAGCDELVLYTYLTSEMSPGDAAFKELWSKAVKTLPSRTYQAALRAMIYEEVDRVRYQGRIHALAQFLVDNQCQNGQWSYGELSPAVPDVPGEEAARAPVASSGDRSQALDFGRRSKPKVVRKLPVRRTKLGPASGDNSNSQYAALGLRACHESGIQIPKDTLQLARKAWVDCQHSEIKNAPEGAVATGAGGAPRGWCYDLKDAHRAYSSMTAGAVGAVVIYDHLLGRDWNQDRIVKDGMEWLSRHFTVAENAGPPEVHGGGTNHYYYLYALERAGVLYGTEKMGSHFWYPEGAKVILDQQKPDGSWEGGSKPVWDTCYAILFLKRATRPLVASEDRLSK